MGKKLLITTKGSFDKYLHTDVKKKEQEKTEDWLRVSGAGRGMGDTRRLLERIENFT